MAKFIGLTAALLTLSTAAFADVVELRTGQRIEGKLKQATPTTVTIEVGGRTLTVEGAKVRAIYYDDGSKTAEKTGAGAMGATPKTADLKDAAIAACRSKLGPITVEATSGNLSAGELNVVARCSDGKRCLCWATRRGQTWTTEILR